MPGMNGIADMNPIISPYADIVHIDMKFREAFYDAT